MNTTLLVQNHYNTLQNTAHSISANAEAVDHEAWRVANGRRSLLDYWAPTTPNTDAWIKVDCGSSKAADTVFIDRGHNLEGKTVRLQKSTDDFAANTVEVFSVTFPAAVSAPTALSAANGAYTEEGAWGKSFTSTSSRYWRLHVAAAASYTPRLVGLWLGPAWSPVMPIKLPVNPDGRDLGYQANESDYGWEGSTGAWVRRSGEIVVANDSTDEAAARTFFLAYMVGRPTWLVFDTAKAERAFLAKAPAGRGDFERTRDWFFPTTRIQYVEHEPALL